MQIYFRISDLSALMERRVSEVLAPFSISLWEYRLLRILLEQGPMTAAEIIPQITLEQSLVSRTVQRLFEKGLVSRRRSRKDRRNVTLRATKEGEELAGELAMPLQDLQEDLTRGVPEEWSQEVNQVIETMIDNAQPQGR